MATEWDYLSNQMRSGTLDMVVDGKEVTMSTADYLDAVSVRSKERLKEQEKSRQKKSKDKFITYALGAGIGLVVLGRFL